MKKNLKEEKDHQLLIEDLRQKAEEYNAEGTNDRMCLCIFFQFFPSPEFLFYSCARQRNFSLV